MAKDSVAWAIPEFHPQCSYLVECKSWIELSDHTGCHTPPLYTNNRLTPAEGFKVQEDHLKKDDVLPIPVGTDPNLTLKTRRGTGYYKVPSLKGVWYRGPFEHNGVIANLEDWFDPARLREDYVPTGWKGYRGKARCGEGARVWARCL